MVYWIFLVSQPILSLAGIETPDLTIGLSTKPMHYQLSYPGLDSRVQKSFWNQPLV